MLCQSFSAGAPARTSTSELIPSQKSPPPFPYLMGGQMSNMSRWKQGAAIASKLLAKVEERFLAPPDCVKLRSWFPSTSLRTGWLTTNGTASLESEHLCVRPERSSKGSARIFTQAAARNDTFESAY